MRLRKLSALTCAVVAGLTVGVTTASADPERNPTAGVFTVVCPGMEPFQATAVGAVGFVEGGKLLAVAHQPGTGNLDLVACQAIGETRTFPVFIQFVKRG